MPPWVFCSTTGRPLRQEEVAKGFKRVLKAAGLPLHFTPHGLRHSFSSLLLEMGVSPAYVQRQLGHHSIKLTVDVYGRWLPMGNTANVDRLDGASGSKMVAAGGGREGEGPGILDCSDTSREGGRAAQLTSS
ncbi:MAG: tyrosine-type recombinase/integrase [Candidatus Rokuibacteriota bacterium]